MNRIISYIKRIYKLELSLILFFSLILLSCRSTDTNKISNEQANIIVKLQGDTFEGIEPPKDKVLAVIKDSIQRFEVPFNKDFLISVELLPVTPTVNNQTQSSVELNTLDNNIRYKVVVYKSTGEYVTEKDYTHTQEADTEALNLDGGGSYTFIVYSVNSTTKLPDVTFSNTSNKTLAASSVSALASSDDFMYYQKDMQVSGNDSNYLDVVLKHKLSLITTTIDASATGYNITAVKSNFDSHYPSYSVALSDGSIARTGTLGSISPVFPELGTSVIVSNPTLINGETTTGQFTVSSITIGPLTQTLNRGLTGLKIRPGVKYNLKLRLNPKDIYLDYNGQKAVRINGKIWMRHNLGADTSLDPDQNPSVSGLHGNYYQFGGIKPIVKGTETNANSNFNGYPEALNAWNTGTETAPVKTDLDPCPSGYRVPTATEFQALLDNTTPSNIGTWSEDDNNYTAAKVLTSNKNNNVRIVLPAQGGFSISGDDPPYEPTMINKRGIRVTYWTGISKGHDDVSYFEGDSNKVIVFVETDDHSANRVIGKPIRCIVE